MRLSWRLGRRRAPTGLNEPAARKKPGLGLGLKVDALEANVRRRVRRIEKILSPKIWGLGLLKKAVKQTGGKVLPYIVVRKPDGFSFKRLGGVPARVLVRSDVADQNGITYDQWSTLPRKTFDVDFLHPDWTETDIRRFMQNELARSEFEQKRRDSNPNLLFMVNGVMKRSEFEQKRRDSNAPRIPLFFVVHPLRPKADYVSSGQVNFDAQTGTISIQIASSPQGLIFRFSHSAQPPSKTLEQRLHAMVSRLKALGVETAEFSFATYKDAPDEPEYYDLLLNKN